MGSSWRVCRRPPYPSSAFVKRPEGHSAIPSPPKVLSHTRYDIKVRIIQVIVEYTAAATALIIAYIIKEPCRKITKIPVGSQSIQTGYIRGFKLQRRFEEQIIMVLSIDIPELNGVTSTAAQVKTRVVA